MFEELILRAGDLRASRDFYSTVLAAIGVAPDDGGRWMELRVAQADDEHPPTRGLHLGFAAPSRAHVDAFWRAGIDAGHPDDGAPGPRPQYREDYYGAFLLDPDGNSAEAVHHGGLSHDGLIDHLWIRVADVGAARAFYAGLAPSAGFRLRADTPERAQFVGRGASFSVVAGDPAEHVHMAFAASRTMGPLTDPEGNRVELRAAG